MPNKNSKNISNDTVLKRILINNKKTLIKYKYLVFLFVFIFGALIKTISDTQEGVKWDFLGDFGIFLAASVAIPFIYDLFIKDAETAIKEVEHTIFLNELRNEVKQIISEDLMKNYISYGFEGFVRKMDFQILFDDLEENAQLFWLDTYCPDHPNFHTDITNAISRGANIKMLVIHPYCDNCKLRGEELGGYYEENFSEQINVFIKAMIQCAKKLNGMKGELEIRLYSDLPCMPIYIITDNGSPLVAYTSFFLKKATGAGFPHLK